MPIGKNSIKRVNNGGYSNVRTSAPDMENSTVLANPSPEVLEVFIAPKQKKTVEKSKEKVTKTVKVGKAVSKSKSVGSSEKSVKKDVKNTALQPAKTAPKTKGEHPESVNTEPKLSYVNLGKPLPPHLL